MTHVNIAYCCSFSSRLANEKGYARLRYSLGADTKNVKGKATTCPLKVLLDM